MAMVNTVDLNIKILEDNKWELTKSNEILRYMNIFNRTSSGAHKIVVLENKRLNNTHFVGMIPNVTGKVNSATIKNKLKVFERIILIQNELMDTRFPELVDLTKVFINGVEFPMLVTEYVIGKNLDAAIHTDYFAKTKGDKIYDPTARKKANFNLRRIKSIMFELVELQQKLLEYNTVHVGLFPEHIIILIDDLVKVRGFRFIIGTDGKYVSDKAILQTEYYGPIVHRRYTSRNLVDYFQSSGKQKIKIERIISYQIGMLIFDLLTAGAYKSKDFTPSVDIINNATFRLAPYQQNAVKNILVKLIIKNEEITIQSIKNTLSMMPE